MTLPNDKPQRILVTGATGFLGYRTCEILLAQGYDVIATGRNLQKAYKLKSIGAKFIQSDLVGIENISSEFFVGLDAIIHCAALSSVWGKYDDFYKSNVLGTQSVVELARKHEVKNLIHISTPTIYVENKSKHNIQEDSALPEKFINHYAKTKYLAEQVILKHREIFTKTVILRPQGIYGKGDTAIKPRLTRLMKKNILVQFGKRENLIDITHVDNVVHAICLALKSKNVQHEIFNITDGHAVQTTKYLSRIYKYLNINYKLKIISLKKAHFIASTLEWIYRSIRSQNEPLLTLYSVITMSVDRTLDISKAQKILGYNPIIKQDDGLNLYLKWWKEDIC